MGPAAGLEALNANFLDQAFAVTPDGCCEDEDEDEGRLSEEEAASELAEFEEAAAADDEAGLGADADAD